MIEPSRINDYIPPNKKQKINNNQEEDGFRWNHTSYHITMKGHIDPQEYHDWVIQKIGKRKLTHFSIPNEISDANDPYDHTHAALRFDKPPGWKDSKHLLHPKCTSNHYDVKPITSKKHWDQIFLEYHRGHKQDKETGEYKDIPPIKLIQSDYDPNEKPFSEQVRDKIRSCNTWKEVLDLDENISKYIAIRMHWAKDIFLHRDLNIQCRIETLFEWQDKLTLEVQEDPDPRKIIWYIDKQGGKGKSELTKYLVKRHGAFLAQGKSTDIKYAYNGEKIVIFDIPRSADHISWDAIESIKNGLFFNTKYYSHMKGFPTPHVICFSNNSPPYDKLSQDRWDVRYIDPMEDPFEIKRWQQEQYRQHIESKFED
jgi:hypothetical protein